MADPQGYPQWEYYFLRAIQAPVNQVQLQALDNWWRSEGMPTETNNWLAITSNDSLGLNVWGPSSGIWNSFGKNKSNHVLTYATRSTGINALVDFLNNGHEEIITAFRDPGASLDSIAAAVAKDGGWGKNDPKIIANATGIYTNQGEPVIKQGDSGIGKGFTQCGQEPAVLGTPSIPLIGSFTLISACQGKALVGGLLVVAGSTIMGLGISVLIIKYGSQAAASVANDLVVGPTKGINAIRGAASGLSKATKRTPKTAPKTSVPE